MTRITAALLLAAGLFFSSPVAPAAADDSIYVDTFVVPDPSLDGCSLGNGITFVGDQGVAWTIDGAPYAFAPADRTLWLPDGFKGTITATSTVPGVELYERSADRSGTTLSWEQVVTPTSGLCARLTDLASQRADLAARVAQLDATVAQQADKIDRQAATIKRLRAKIRRLQ